MGTKNIGTSFDSFLEEEGLLEETTATAVKRYIAYQLAKKMSKENLSKSEMARRMETSRSALDRLLDPSNSSVTLQTLQSAAHALGGRLKVELDFQKCCVSHTTNACSTRSKLRRTALCVTADARC